MDIFYSPQKYVLFLTCVWFLSDLEVLRSFQNQIAAIQRDAVWWLHTVVPTISKVGAKDYVHWSVTVLSTVNV